jgi:amino acid adenylation domain-containing protein
LPDKPDRPDRDVRRALLARVLAEKASEPLKVEASSGQKRLWFAMRAAPESPVYNCPLTLEIRGRVEVEALTMALAALVHRHEALRTIFQEEEGELFQIVAPRGELPLERREARGREEALRYAKDFARAPFDLARGPLYRAALVTMSADESLLLLNCHHIVSDGWSQGIVLRELLGLYRAFLVQEKTVLDPLPLSYADFARWQRKRELPPASRQYWARALEGVEPLRLPTDFARPPLPTSAGARIAVRLSAESARAVARRDDASLYQVVLAAFQMVLSIWCQQERFVVGTPAHNRNRAEVEGIVGFFVSTVPVRADFGSDPTLKEALARVRRNALEALAEGEVPFEELVALSKRAKGVPPLVQALFVWQESLMPELDLGDVRVHAGEEDTETSKFDLTLSLRPIGDILEGHVELNTDLFHAKSIEWMIDRLEPMLAAMQRTPEAHLHSMSLDVETPVELSLGTVLPASNDTAESFARTVHRFAQETALETPARRLTFAELDRAASALAARWRARGHQHGEPVALLLPTSVEAVVAIVAAWKRGSPYVPLDPSWPEARIDRILNEIGARVRLRENEFAWEELLDPGAERVSIGALPAGPADLAYIIHTSGSTGEPKGVMVSHRSLAHLDRALESSVYGRADRPRRVGIFGPLSFDTTVKQLVRLLRGDCLCPIPQELKASPARLVSYLQGAALDVIDMTPSWLRVLADAGLAPPMPRTFLLGGEPIDPALWHDLAIRQARGEAAFVNLYGPTEATVDATFATLDLSREPSIGTPLPNTRIWLLDSRSRSVPPGFVGEIAIGGEGVALGYWNRRDETSRAFTEIVLEGQRERVYKTGDFARFRGDGHLVFLGRRDRQVKRNGQRVELDEIEGVLRAQEAVAEAAVAEVEGRIVAWCVGRGEGPSELPERAARILPRGFLPDEYHFVAALPRNRSGKIDYAALTNLPANSPAPRAGKSGSALRGEHEKAIAEVWAELLGSPPAHSGADFFEAGGDSLLGLRLLARIEKRYGIRLDVSMLASSPTPETLAAALASEFRRDPVVWFRRGSEGRTPLVFVHATGGDVACYRHLSSLLPNELPVAGVPAPLRLPETLEELAREHARSLEKSLPSRDVVLAGWSLGGVVAVEVARALRERGFRVPLVLLLDSRLPSSPLGLSGADDSRLPETSRKLLRLWHGHSSRRYDGDALLIRAVLDSGEGQAALWRELLPHLVVIPSRLDHQQMMRPPQVARVAQIAARALHGVDRGRLLQTDLQAVRAERARPGGSGRAEGAGPRESGRPPRARSEGSEPSEERGEH